MRANKRTSFQLESRESNENDEARADETTGGESFAVKSLQINANNGIHTESSANSDFPPTTLLAA